MSSKISWTDETINPVVGCSKISAGCQNCYAEKMARRLAAMGLEQYIDVIGLPPHTSAERVELATGKTYSNVGWNGKTSFVVSELEKPRKWKKPKSIFVSSMGDLFHESVDIKWQLAVMEMVAALPHHTFIFLTKRPANMKIFMDAWVAESGGHLPNLVLGVSVEDQETADERIPVLLKTPAAKRFISLEPMIGSVDLMNMHGPGNCRYQVLMPIVRDDDAARPALDCVILGGESGPNARPLHPEWVRLVRDQCAAAGVPFFFKQWGEWAPYDGSTPNTCDYAEQTKYRTMEWENDQWNDVGYPLWCDFEDNLDAEECTGRVGSKKAGNMIDGRTHTELAWEVRK